MSDCVLWTKSVGSHGYGAAWDPDARVVTTAHRLAWKQAKGPIPPGLTIDHLCRNRLCVNVEHMELVPIGVNVLRGEGPSAREARQTHCIRGHDLALAYVWRGRKRVCRECKRERDRRYRA